MWKDIVDYPAYTDPDGLFLASNATRTYARGIAFAAMGCVDEALREQAIFARECADEKTSARILHNNVARDLFAIGAEMLAGEICYRPGKI